MGSAPAPGAVFRALAENLVRTELLPKAWQSFPSPPPHCRRITRRCVWTQSGPPEWINGETNRRRVNRALTGIWTLLCPRRAHSGEMACGETKVGWWVVGRKRDLPPQSMVSIHVRYQTVSWKLAENNPRLTCSGPLRGVRWQSGSVDTAFWRLASTRRTPSLGSPHGGVATAFCPRSPWSCSARGRWWAIST